jgi:hypothetical protein
MLSQSDGGNRRSHPVLMHCVKSKANPVLIPDGTCSGRRQNGENEEGNPERKKIEEAPFLF